MCVYVYSTVHVQWVDRCAHICIYFHVRKHTHLCVCPCIRHWHAHFYVLVHVYIQLDKRTYTHLWMYACLHHCILTGVCRQFLQHTNMRTSMYVGMYDITVYIRARTFLRIHIQMYTALYSYVYTYTCILHCTVLLRMYTALCTYNKNTHTPSYICTCLQCRIHAYVWIRTTPYT